PIPFQHASCTRKFTGCCCRSKTCSGFASGSPASLEIRFPGEGGATDSFPMAASKRWRRNDGERKVHGAILSEALHPLWLRSFACRNYRALRINRPFFSSNRSPRQVTV